MIFNEQKPEVILKVFAADIKPARRVESNVRTGFLNWLRIMNQTPTVFYRGEKLFIGLPFEFTKWICVNPLDHPCTGILKFVCGPPADVSNDNFQV